jgi:tetratricopeptide (TPR) repeat protein
VSPGGSKSDFADRVGVLRRRELVTLADGYYALHPRVRRYAYRHLKIAARKAAHQKAASYLADRVTLQEPDDAGNAVSADVMVPRLLELYYQRVGAEDWDHALGMLGRLRQELYYRFGSYALYADALSALINEDPLEVCAETDDYPQTWTLNVFGNALVAIGRPRDAIAMFRRARELRSGVTVNSAVDAGNLGARCFLPLGLFREAEAELLERGRLARTVYAALSAAPRTPKIAHEIWLTHEINEPIGHSDLGYLYGLSGRHEASEAEFERARALFQDEQSLGVVERLRGEVALLRCDLGVAEDCAVRATSLAAADTLPRDLIHLNCLRGGIEVALAEKSPVGSACREAHLVAAEGYLDDAWTQCGRSSLIEAEPKILIAWGHWHRVGGRSRQAKTSFERAWEVAEMCGYRLNQADAQHGQAQLAVEHNDYVTARTCGDKALALAGSDSPEFRYELAVERIRRLLDAIP